MKQTKSSVTTHNDVAREDTQADFRDGDEAYQDKLAEQQELESDECIECYFCGARSSSACICDGGPYLSP